MSDVAYFEESLGAMISSHGRDLRGYHDSYTNRRIASSGEERQQAHWRCCRDAAIVMLDGSWSRGPHCLHFFVFIVYLISAELRICRVMKQTGRKSSQGVMTGVRR
nr:hypothetical protein CFP56_13497 [Quercus suber]